MEVLKKEPHIHNKTAALVLENGEILWGYGLGEKKAAVGELCFNTCLLYTSDAADED